MATRPYRVPLSGDAAPAAVLAALATNDYPAALWGRWFGGGVLMMRRPLRRAQPLDAADAFAILDERPDARSLAGEADPTGLVGGGWLACLGYDRGTSSLAFYDSLLRWQPGSGWAFESLGLRGQEETDATALSYWRSVLARATAAEPPLPSSAVGPFAGRPDAAQLRDRYLAAVEGVIRQIHRGAYYQLNLCIRLRAERTTSGGRGDGSTHSSMPALFARMAEQLQPAYGGLVVSGGEGAWRGVVSLSPELFLSVRGRRVATSPIKGTAPRSADGTGSAALRASAKDAAENVMIVDLMRNDLSRVCEPGTVRVPELLAVEPHPGVWHLVSRVEGDLDHGTPVSALLAAAFPPGSVTGAPKDSARRGIASLEPEPRGAYTGSMGLVSPLAGTDLNVLIRSLEVTADRVELGVGGGITVDSVPVREWYECLHKAAPLVLAAGSALDPEFSFEPAPQAAALVAGGVFESVLVRRGRPIRLPAHLARLDLSCRELYGAGLPEDLAARIFDLLAIEPHGDRVALRVVARPRGEPVLEPAPEVAVEPATPEATLEVAVEARVLPPPRTLTALRRGVREQRSWRHKWLDRRDLDRAAAAAAPALPYFLSGPSGSIAETDRGNLFLLDDSATWCTPLLDEHVLPGVTRREVIDLLDDWSEPVAIRRCSPAELHQARAAFWTSSLSGAVAVTAVDDVNLAGLPALLGRLNAALGSS